MRVGAPIPPKPLVVDLRLDQLSDAEWRRWWHDENLWWSIAVQVRKLRESQGLSILAMAQKCGVGHQVISRAEDPNSKSKLTLASLLKIAKAFDCALVCRFVPWSEFIRWIGELQSGGWALPPGFDKEPREQWEEAGLTPCAGTFKE